MGYCHSASDRATEISEKRVAMWVAQHFIAVVFIGVGYMKATMPIASLAQIVPWAAPPLLRSLSHFMHIEVRRSARW
jgi:hypothetical protein